MSLYILTVKRPETCDLDPGDKQDWYFENYQHFLRAKALAERHGIYVGDNTDNPEIITDLDEFTNWLDEVLPEKEDALTTALREFRAIHDAYDAASKEMDEVTKRRDEINKKLQEANRRAFSLLSDGAVKVVDDKAYVKSSSWVLIKDAL